MTQFAGIGLLVRLTLRRDRVMLPLWIGALVATVAATITAFDDLYPDQPSRDEFATSIRSNAVFRAFYGALSSAGSNGALTAWRLGTLGAVALGLMSIFLITRHTRGEEETGRLELVGAGAVGRLAPLTSAMAVAVAANLLAAALMAAVLVGAGEGFADAVAFGLALAGGGLFFAGTAAVAAQLTETARAANGMAVGTLATAFVLRAAGDGSDGNGWLSWLSPIGWVGQVRAFDADRFWVIALLLVVAAALGVLAATLNATRDLNGSLLRTRPGPARAARSLVGVPGLVWRLHRSGLAGWAVGFLVLGAVFGSLAGTIGGLVNTSPQIAEVLRQIGGPGALVDGYFAGVLGILALVAAGYGVSVVRRLRAAELGVLVEPVLATGISRRRLLRAQAVLVFLAPAALMLLAGLVAGVAADAVLDDGEAHLPALLAASAVQLPAIWVTGGVATALFGLLPRWTVAAWGALAACGLLTELGSVLGLPQLVLDLSPFTAVPRIVGDGPIPVTPILVLTAVAVALTAAGFAGFRQRDIG